MSPRAKTFFYRIQTTCSISFFVVCGFCSFLFELTFFKNILLRIPLKFQTVWINIWSDAFVGPNQCLDCKWYQQTTLVVKPIKFLF